MKASIVITTKNRKDDLRTAVLSAVTQTIEPQVIVIDDGSTDGTAEMIASEFPSVHLVTHSSSCGYIVRRNEGALLSRGDVIFSIDDDAEFSSPYVCEMVLPYFHDPRVAAVAIPYREPYKDNVLRQVPKTVDNTWITGRFIGTSHAVKRSLFLAIGGYRECLVHQGEEDDFAIRLYDAGYCIALASSPEVLHYESPKRDFRRMDFFGARNQLLWVWSYSPAMLLPFLFILRMLSLFRFSFTLARQHCQFEGMWASFVEILNGWSRTPVQFATLLLYFRLKDKPLRISSLSSLPNS